MTQAEFLEALEVQVAMGKMMPAARAQVLDQIARLIEVYEGFTRLGANTCSDPGEILSFARG